METLSKDVLDTANLAWMISVSWGFVGLGQEAHHKQLSQQIVECLQRNCQLFLNEQDHRSEHHDSVGDIQEFLILTELPQDYS